MSPTRSLILAFGCATALSSCHLFKKDPPAEDPYAAANPYAPGAAGAAGQPQGYPAAGAYDAYGQPAPGGYAPPTYAPPTYSQPPAPTAPGYASTPPPVPNYNAASGSGRTHKVVSGDNLTRIATRYGVSVGALKSANNLQTDLIRQGETLRIP